MTILADTITSQTVSVNTTVGQIIAWIVIGLLAGLVASLFYQGRKSLGGVLLVGLIGALVGGFLFDILNVEVTGSLNNGILIRWIDLIVALIGSILVLFVTSSRMLRRL